MERPDKILTDENIEKIIDEHIHEEIYKLETGEKICNFKRDKLLERTLMIMNEEPE